MSERQRFHIRNWRDYNAALVNRGSITFWFSEDIIQGWHAIEKTGKRGRPKVYTDMAIQGALTVKAVFCLPLRGTEGFIRSLIGLLKLPITAPDYTTLCLRQQELEVCLPTKDKQRKLDIVIDSTGLKVYGEGEWKVRQHGYTKRRTWRKVHLAVDPDKGEIEAVVVTTNDFKDSEVLPDLLEHIDGKLGAVSGDGGYDSIDSYERIGKLGANPLIPPRKDAVISKHGNFHSPPLLRDEVIRAIRRTGRKAWKRSTNYHQRSLAETAMYRLKTAFGDKLSARNFVSQAQEVFIRCVALNKMNKLGMPDSYRVHV